MPIKRDPGSLKLTRTDLEDLFIDDFLVSASALELKVYILGLRLLKDGQAPSLTHLAKVLGVKREEVLDAYKHWQKLKIVDIEMGADEPMISYIPIINQYIENNYTRNQPKKQREYQYDQLLHQISELLQPEPLRRIEEIELLEFLLDHDFEDAVVLEAYKSASKYSSRTRVAIKILADWAIAGAYSIEAVQEIQNQFNQRNRDYSLILKALGKPYSQVSAGEQESIDYWLDELHLDMDTILEKIKEITKKIPSVNMNYLSKVFESNEPKETEDDDQDYSKYVKEL